MSQAHRRRNQAFVLAILGLTAGFGIGIAFEREECKALKAELTAIRAEVATLDRLRAENERLKQKLIPEDELNRLRVDRAALPRLRAELQALEAGAVNH